MDYSCFSQCKTDISDSRDTRPSCSSLPSHRRLDLYCIDPAAICNSYDTIYSSVLVTMSTVVVIFFVFQPINIGVILSLKRKCEIQKAPWVSTVATLVCFFCCCFFFLVLVGLAVWSLIVDDPANLGRRIGGALLSIVISVSMGIIVPLIIMTVAFWCCFSWSKVNKQNDEETPVVPTNENK